eukprot:CAMPEP_0172512472 /NCGR_PEP_ID=MMETSP1066-20121228/244928_1 /TAXON_ID=671091 /ORGANISM="Coscinodiscus wailesii, Strain CCMP2513" /LENGTH=541 /DNA_ID=CAMNT_0013292309 /DNA_START=483 /DNA_END=2108 /DNA_ORIENTATION=-
MTSSLLGFYLAYNNDNRETILKENKPKELMCIGRISVVKKYHWPFGTTVTCIICLSVALAVLNALTTVTQVISPSWLQNPFLWGQYRLYKPEHIKSALQGICLDYRKGDSGPPLCLSKSSWNFLTAGTITGQGNSSDVDAVLDGIEYAKRDTTGLVINILARDTIDSVEPLRQNVEGLVPFFSKLSVVVFENDSIDGTRDAFKKWSSEANGYNVDIIECGETRDCKFGESHRYDSSEAKQYFMSSAIGKMAVYRQRISDYIRDSPKYADYSHMLVMDLDLGVSLSPFGILHSLGRKSDSVVISSGRQVWPGSMGTLIPPYDFSAARFIQTPHTQFISRLHDMFCELKPPGDRWRNQCDATSAMHLFFVLLHDLNSDFYEVLSGFNGATLYPLKIVRESGAKYDAGDDGQRCEHVGYNLSLKSSLFVNPKWNMHVDPSRPAGPSGSRAMKNALRISVNNVGIILMIVEIIGMMLLISITVMIVMHIVYPLWSKVISGTKFGSIIKAFLVGKREAKDENMFYDFYPEILIRKRKDSDGDEAIV